MGVEFTGWVLPVRISLHRGYPYGGIIVALYDKTPSSRAPKIQERLMGSLHYERNRGTSIRLCKKIVKIGKK
jgi:hypothetical protein